MALVCSSDDIDREYLLLAGIACFTFRLRNEPFSLLVLPMTAISGVMAALCYPVLHKRSRSGRVLWMYLGFIVSLVIYGLYLWWLVPDGTVWLVLLALLAGHTYGLPPFLAVVLASLLLNRIEL